jgi:hypothetical protein
MGFRTVLRERYPQCRLVNSGGRNPDASFPGHKRSNATHASSTDPQAGLYKKGAGKEAKLCFMGHGLMENRHGFWSMPA